MPISDSFVSTLRVALGDKAVVTDGPGLHPFLVESRGLFQGDATVVVRPGSTQDVATTLSLCADHSVSVVPQGGNTGLVGGAVGQRGQLILSLSRLNAVRSVDPENFSMTVEAGCVLEDIQRSAEKADRLFPLSLGAQGSCQIGGTLATNAGGLNFLAYGGARDLCLGLEVVLADGAIWSDLSTVRKDNAGYNLKPLFIGSEGTLGIITAAVLKLFPRSRQKRTAFCAFEDLGVLPGFLAFARSCFGHALTAFELIGKTAFQYAVSHVDRVHDPFREGYPWYLLVEVSVPWPGDDLRELFERFLESVFEKGEIVNAVLAESGEQEQMFWRLREGIPEAQKREGKSIKSDVSVPIPRIPEFLNRSIAAVVSVLPGIRPCVFGHVGDGNIHFNLSQPVGMDQDVFLSRWGEMNRIVHDIVSDLGGSIAAEHGIGRLKTGEIERYKDPVALALMRAIKKRLDPEGILNPGVVLRWDTMGEKNDFFL